MATIKDLFQCVLTGDADNAEVITKELIDQGVKPVDIINEGLIGAMTVVGARFKADEMFVPEVLISSNAMKAAMEIVKPLIAAGDIKSLGTIVIGTVAGDLHDIGKSLVSMMAESIGFKVIDLGADVESIKFVEAAKEYNADIVGISALLTTTMPCMPEIIDLFKEEGLRDKVKIFVGGAPVSEEFAKSIGADGWAADAADAADRFKQAMGL